MNSFSAQPRTTAYTTLMALYSAIMVVALLTGIWSFTEYTIENKNQDLESKVKGILDSPKIEESMLANIRTHFILPINESPKVKYIKDSSELKSNDSLYSNVEDGDIMLIYKENNLILIYNPSKNILSGAGSYFANEEVKIQTPPKELEDLKLQVSK